MKRISIILIWLCCSFLNWGLTLGNFTHRFPYMENTQPAIIFAIMGPFGVPVTLITSSPHFRFRLLPISVEERWKIFHNEMPTLSREYFEENFN